MNAEELSLIGPVVDLTSVDAIHRKRLVAFVNHFLIHTASFLNRLSRSCDSKLFQLQLRMQKLEAAIILLESKLSSIPGLDISTPVEMSAKVPAEETPVTENIPAPDQVTKANEESERVEEPKEEAQQQLDPDLQKFAKMLQVGVPLPAVKLKMQQEGISIERQNLILNQ